MTPEARAKKNQRDREWRLAHPGYMTEKHRDWRRTNPEKERANSAAKRARRAAVTQQCPAAVGQDIETLDVFCQLCFRGASHLDHIIPLSRGGCSALHNLQWLCASCNVRKHASLDMTYLGCPEWSGHSG